DEARAEPVLRDQAGEAAVGDGPDADPRPECLPGEDFRRNAGPATGHDLGAGLGNAERALQEVLRIGTKLVADRLARHARRVETGIGARPNNDLLPADPLAEVRIAVVEPRRLAAPKRLALIDDLEPGRVQAGLARRKSKRVAQ